MNDVEAVATIVPLGTMGIFCIVFGYSIYYFRHLEIDNKCPHGHICDDEHLVKCRESDKALVAAMGAVALLFLVAQSLELISTGFFPKHAPYQHVWHGYDFFSAVTWLLIIHHLRARLGWRRKR